MKLPRDLSGESLARALSRFGYARVRQSGSHMRLMTRLNGEHHVTVRAHDPLKLGTLNCIVRDVAEHVGLTRDELLKQLFE